MLAVQPEGAPGFAGNPDGGITAVAMFEKLLSLLAASCAVST